MSEQFIDVDEDEYLDAPKALRDAYKKLVRQHTEIVKERDTFKSVATERALGDVLKDFKNPKRVQRDLASDGIDPLDSEAVSAWLEENGDDYAKGEGSTPPAPRGEDPDAAAQRQIAGADLQTPADMTKLEAALAELGDDATPEQVIKVYQSHGV